MASLIQRTLKKLPYFRRLYNEMDQLRTELLRWNAWKPPGHFYSPIPSLEEIKKDENDIFSKGREYLLGVDLNEEVQLNILDLFSKYYSDLPFQAVKKDNLRYYFENPYYSYADAIVLYSIMRIVRPKRIIEVGSGFSSAAILDTNDLFFDSSISCTFIDPDSSRLKQLLSETDMRRSAIIEKKIQEVPSETFSELSAGDILFIDSSHVSKTGSDLNRIIFEILPRLQDGVYIHFHDVFYPFEYPKGWVYAGVAWNEAYMLHSFLQYNQVVKICFFTSFIMQEHINKVEKIMPLALKSEKPNITLADAPGGSLWLQKQDQLRSHSR